MLTFPAPPKIPRPIFGGTMSAIDTRQITPVESGAPRIRRTSRIEPTEIPCTWILTDDEYDNFESFYDFGLHGGADAFIFPVRHGSRYVDREVIFSQRPSWSDEPPSHRRVTATMLVMERLGIPLLRELDFNDAGTILNITAPAGTSLAASHNPWGVDIYTWVAPSSAALMRVGRTSASSAYVTDVDVSAVGCVRIRPGDGNAGAELGVDQASARTATCKLTGTALTTGQFGVVVLWKPV